MSPIIEKKLSTHQCIQEGFGTDRLVWYLKFLSQINEKLNILK